jgi:hypothetical protein
MPPLGEFRERCGRHCSDDNAAHPRVRRRNMVGYKSQYPCVIGQQSCVAAAGPRTIKLRPSHFGIGDRGFGRWEVQFDLGQGCPSRLSIPSRVRRKGLGTVETELPTPRVGFPEVLPIAQAGRSPSSLAGNLVEQTAMYCGPGYCPRSYAAACHRGGRKGDLAPYSIAVAGSGTSCVEQHGTGVPHSVRCPTNSIVRSERACKKLRSADLYPSARSRALKALPTPSPEFPAAQHMARAY